MTITTKSESEIIPLIDIESVAVQASYTDGTPINGTYQNISTRSINSGRMEYVVTTDADEVINLSPTVLDVSDLPSVRRIVGYTANVGYLVFSKNGAHIRREFQIGDFGQPYDVVVGNSILPGTKLDFFHNLVWAAATAVGKDGYGFRSIVGVSPVAVTGSNIATLEWNPNCWASAWDWTGCPIKNTRYNGPKYGGVMITPRHLLEAEHVPCLVGTTWTFMDAEGNLHTRTSIGKNRRSNTGDYLVDAEANAVPGDMSVHVLDSPLPAGIAHYPVIGSWAYDEIANGTLSPSYPWQYNNTEVKVPLVGMFLDQTMFARFFGSYNNDCSTYGNRIVGATYEGVDYTIPVERIGMTGTWGGTGLSDLVTANTFYRSGISGDSGSPVFVPLSSNAMALMFCFTVPGGGSFPYEPRINALIASADADAVARGNLVSPTGLTVTVAPDPTL